MEGYKIELIIAAASLLFLLLGLIRQSSRQDPPIRIPPELLQGTTPPQDPFRSPTVFAARMEDFGRFNTRYNETDGIIPERELFRDSKH